MTGRFQLFCFHFLIFIFCDPLGSYYFTTEFDDSWLVTTQLRPCDEAVVILSIYFLLDGEGGRCTG